MELQDEVAIESVSISNDWVKTDYEPDPETMAVGVTFAHRDDNEVTIRFYCSGLMVGTDVGKKFFEILKMPLHNLDEKELAYMAVTSGGMGDEIDFDTEFARTEKLDGKTVLSIKGIWKENQFAAHAYLVPSDEAGRKAQSIQYIAPAQKAEKYRSSFEKVISTLKWKKHVHF